MNRFIGHTLSSVACLCLIPSLAGAQVRTDKMTELSLEELLNRPVVTVSRTTEGAASAPGRVEVITAAQIERRGYRALTDLLRDIPGMKVDLGVDQDLSADVTVQGTR